MKFINIAELEEYAKSITWEVTEQAHLDAMANLSIKERKKYIHDHPDWNVFQSKMMEMSNNKCWYSEAPAGNNDLSVDHFRPKNRAVYAENYKDTNSPVHVIKKNGYWWKAYSLDNFRLCGTYSNLRRSDRLNPKEGTKGKGNYFPLDLNGGGRIADDGSDISSELTILLDPTKKADVALLTFEPSGVVISAGETDYEHNRVLQSIFYYHLDLEQLNRERRMAWKDCESEIDRAKKAIDNAPNEAAKRFVLNECFEKLSDYVKNPDRSYSAVTKTCVIVYSGLNKYVWLKNFVRTNLL